VVDFGGCESLPAAAKATLYAWLARFRVTPRENLEAELAKLAAKHGLALRFERLYRGYSYYAVLTRR
jgi:S-adenosylmethionine-diacylgycerolhomoserine-N-methlytransferase